MTKKGRSSEDQPLDWIYCPDGRMKAVVACMAHCQRRCDAFWLFFRQIQKTPREYYNKDNIGELCMRRVVFDCDRCGRKDIGRVFSRYDENLYPEEKLLDRKGMESLLEESDYLYHDIGVSFFQVLQIMEKEKKWRHFCDKCFAKTLNAWAQIMDIKKRGRKVLSDSVPKDQRAVAEKKAKSRKSGKQTGGSSKAA
ncbi:hypothetical protein JXQ70_06325 [bacterium]|nr:hypothetical protein [bacterium]